MTICDNDWRQQWMRNENNIDIRFIVVLIGDW